MRTSRIPITLPPAAMFVAAVACTNPVTYDSTTVPPVGVIRGTVLYSGPRPCSSNGHIVGNAVLLVFDRRNQPPPNGLANTAVNFADVTGDVLFPQEPRWTGSDVYCPADHGFTETVNVSAPFAISPLAAGSYLIEAFFDTTGDFRPTFKFRNLPERGDVGGGDIDVAAALAAVNQNPNYMPHFLPVDVGVPASIPADAGALDVPNFSVVPKFTIPPQGFVADNVTVTIGQTLSTTRPYFYAEGLTTAVDKKGTLSLALAQESDVPEKTMTGIKGTKEADPNYMPVLTIPQDIQVLGANVLAPGVFEGTFPHLRLDWGVAPGEVSLAQATPFDLQVAPFAATPAGGKPAEGLMVWQKAYFDPTKQTWIGQDIPEGQVPFLWPLVVLSKLADDPGHVTDPASLQAQGDAKHPVVILQGITLLGQSPEASSATDGDSLIGTVSASFGGLIGKNGQPTIFVQDHLTVVLRPAVICFDHLFDGSYDPRGTIVTPWQKVETAQIPPMPNGPLVDTFPSTLLTNTSNDNPLASVTNLVNAEAFGCLPKGRYSINVVYPDGQAWTVPNEAGACTGPQTGEGDTYWSASPPTCTLEPRKVIRSQGPRAVVEIVDPVDPANCQGTPSPTHPGPVPAVCMPTTQ